jgi:hypothetical protein
MGWAEAKAGYKDSWLKVAVVYATYLICLTLVEGTESWNTNSNLKKIAEIKKLIAGAQK